MHQNNRGTEEFSLVPLGAASFPNVNSSTFLIVSTLSLEAGRREPPEVTLLRSRSYVYHCSWTLEMEPDWIGTDFTSAQNRGTKSAHTATCSGVPQRPEGWNALIPPPPVSHTHPIKNVRHAHTCKHTKTHTETAEEEKRRRREKKRRGGEERMT